MEEENIAASTKYAINAGNCFITLGLAVVILLFYKPQHAKEKAFGDIS